MIALRIPSPLFSVVAAVAFGAAVVSTATLAQDRGTLDPKPLPPLADGQVWRVGDMNLQVNRVGPMLVQYKLAKPDAVRVRTLINGKAAIEKYLKTNKAVLLPA